MENCLPFTDDVMVVLVHKCVQQTHLLALHLETLGYIPRLLNALNGLVYFLIIGDPRGDNLMVGSISRKLLTELGTMALINKQPKLSCHMASMPINDRRLIKPVIVMLICFCSLIFCLLSSRRDSSFTVLSN